MKRGSPPLNDRLTELAVDSDLEAQEYFLSGSPVIHKGGLSMEARAPVAASLNYPVEFASLTGGNGVLSTRFSGYEPCLPEMGKTAKRRGIDPRDRAKWILPSRGAL